jgi:hypothetical protein
MPAELGGSQISSLLESLPGIANVLRSPVADALLNAIRGACGLGEFTEDDAEELIRYAIRRGLMGSDEGERALEEARAALQKRKGIKPKPKAKAKGKAAKPKRKR